MSTPISHLTDLAACSDAVEWVRASKCPSLETAWDKCERGDWMLWYAGKKAGPVGDEKRKTLVLAACGCTRLTLPLYEKRYPGDKRVRDCIETAEKWARNEATLEALQVSRRNCYAAAAAYYYAYAAGYAADAAGAAAVVSGAASAAAYAASAAAAVSDAASAARSKTLKQCADIVRTFYPELPT